MRHTRHRPSGSPEPAGDPDARWLGPVVHLAFYALLGGSLARYLMRHPLGPGETGVIVAAALLALLYALGPVAGPARGRDRSASRPLTWLVAVVAAWSVLTLLAPSFAWCAAPLLILALRSLPAAAAVPLACLLTVLVVVSLQRLSDGLDPAVLVTPPAVAALMTGVFLHMERQADRRRALIEDLVRTRRDLAATERREGALAERERLSMEIHDTLAQGLSSQKMLLQAAERVWTTDPAAAREHVREAARAVGRDLAEARRFVHDLAPADLADGGSLSAALRRLAERETADGLTVRHHVEGVPLPLPDRGEAALLRIAQGALANVRRHAGAGRAAVTLSYLDDQVVLDVADDGRGFDPGALPAPGREGGHGLPAMRARVAQLGGTLTVESAPGEGTVLTASIPLTAPEPR
ncbi:sensor histidine kinase [Streptomyces sp. MJP52]|uniref:sensor histidine kinase n=1 Tax=Streptomyces sp. MJP52 TaxID=2940555 RepID=UPI0024740859|nr:sensor histidine kinase [Streptomyces sp. MJP52]MDH6228447.1 signal transduction histidine kinase [Streptomyces sp. MJP52]